MHQLSHDTQDAGPFDVALLGTSLAASTLAAILAAHGARVVVVGEEDSSPFPAGEMGVHASALFGVLAERYAVPELARLADLKELTEHVSTKSGAEHCHSFVYHRPDTRQNPDEVLQISPPKGSPPDPNLYRPDIDAHLLRLAAAKGAVVRRGTKVTGVETGPDGVVLTTSDGETLAAAYLVDASGPGSPLVAALDLAEEPSRFTVRSRTLSTHLTGVLPFDEVVSPASAYRSPTPWTGGSMHHLFDGGYLCLLPFGNHAASTNDTASVALTLDPRRFPAELPPEEEFRTVLARFPTLAAQFAKASPARPWAVSERNQHSLTRTVGDRWCAIGDTAGYVDPFIARSLGIALETVNVLAWRLLDAVREKDFRTERFAPVGRMTRRHLDANDRLAAMWHASLADAALVKSVLYVLEVGFRYGGFPMMIAYGALRSTGSDEKLRELEKAPHLGSVFATHDGFNRLLDGAAARCAAVASGDATPTAAAADIFRSVREADFVPSAFKLGDPSARFFRITPVTIARLLLWSFRGAPADIAPLIRSGIRAVLRGQG